LAVNEVGSICFLPPISLLGEITSPTLPATP
jgi:hypothetical protein